MWLQPQDGLDFVDAAIQDGLSLVGAATRCL